MDWDTFMHLLFVAWLLMQSARMDAMQREIEKLKGDQPCES